MLSLIRDAVGPIVDGLLQLIPDKNARAAAKENFELQILSALTGLVQGQLAINQKEAEHKSIFVAGWRPAIGWICGAGLAWNYVIAPLIIWLAFLFGKDISGAPELNIAELMALLTGMLGMGGLRTYEKRIGVHRDSLD